MKHIRLHNWRWQFIITLLFVIVICLVVFGIITQQKNTASDQKQPASSAKNSQTQSKAPSEEASKQPTKQVEEPTPPTQACKLFTKQLAQQILGGSAALDLNGSVITMQTADVEVSSCTYSAPGKAIQLVAHIAKTSLGQSSNAVAFGSDRPSSAQNTPGYGQAAFWDNGVLHVLKNNTHYEITLGPDVPLDQVELAANILVPKL